MTKQLAFAAAELGKNRLAGKTLTTKMVKAIAAEPKMRKCTASDVARELGISPQHISDIMAGRRGVSDALLGRMLGWKRL